MSSSEWVAAGFSSPDDPAPFVLFTSDKRPGIVLLLKLDMTEAVTRVKVRRDPHQPIQTLIDTRLLRSIPLGELAHQAAEELRGRADRAVTSQPSDDPAAHETSHNPEASN